MKQDKITFSFGKNWKDYLHTVSKEEIIKATENIEDWLGNDFVKGKKVVDIGSGSGIHSLSFFLLDAKSICSFDFDPHSVEATKTLWKKAGQTDNWTVSRGSILDEKYLRSLGQFDIVYSWGVLHHTGSMWQAVKNSFELVKPGGTVWISLYAKGPKYPKHLALKKKYNSGSPLLKKWLISMQIGKAMLVRCLQLKNPFTWNQKRERGMNAYHDIIDWLGGLPYEVATDDEVLSFGRKHGFVLERIRVAGEGGCSIYVFRLPQ